MPNAPTISDNSNSWTGLSKPAFQRDESFAEIQMTGGPKNWRGKHRHLGAYAPVQNPVHPQSTVDVASQFIADNTVSYPVALAIRWRRTNMTAAKQQVQRAGPTESRLLLLLLSRLDHLHLVIFASCYHGNSLFSMICSSALPSSPIISKATRTESCAFLASCLMGTGMAGTLLPRPDSLGGGEQEHALPYPMERLSGPAPQPYHSFHCDMLP